MEHDIKDPAEKIRIRLAAEAYNSNYQALDSDSLDDGASKNSRQERSYRCDRMISPLVMILIVLLLVLAAIILIVALFSIRWNQQEMMCQKQECYMSSGKMLSYVNSSADPCEDFYEYACGLFRKSEIIPPEMKKWSMLRIVSSRVEHELQTILSANSKEYHGVNSSAVEKTKTFYNLCNNLSAIESLGNEPALQLIKSLGSWTVTADKTGHFNAQSFKLPSALAQASLLLASPLFTMSVTTNRTNTSSHTISFGQSGVFFDDYQSYNNNQSVRLHDTYVTYMSTVFKLLSGKDMRKVAEDIWLLEKTLAEAFEPPETVADIEKTFNPMSISHFQNLVGDQLDVEDYLSKMFPKIKFSSAHIIDVEEPDYFKKLNSILSSVTTQTLQNYIVWTTLQLFISDMPNSYRIALTELENKRNGVSGSRSRWQDCTEQISYDALFVVGALYVNEYFPPSDKLKATGLMQDIVKTFGRRVEALIWMDDETKKKAREKLAALGFSIGYPDFILDPSQLDQYYDQWIISDSAFNNSLLMRQFQVQKNLDKLFKSPNKDEWVGLGPQHVNAYYDQTLNGLVIPAAILQKPFFDVNMPGSLIYGNMGMIMGHELTHGFDSQGRRCDQHGNLNNWWTTESAAGFTNRSQCLINQYGKYYVSPTTQLDGVLTLAENIADNGGLSVSFEAFRNNLLKSPKYERTLPGLNLTYNQQFFLSYAQAWCSYYTPEYTEQSVSTDVHSYSKYRVNGVVSNLHEFSTAFNCKSNSQMNPVNKCFLW